MYPLRDLFLSIQIHARPWTARERPMVPCSLYLLLIENLGAPIYSLSPPVRYVEDCLDGLGQCLAPSCICRGEDYRDVSVVMLQTFCFR